MARNLVFRVIIFILIEKQRAMAYYADIILPLSLPKPYTYGVLESQEKHLKTGMRVAVPFGKTKVYTGIVAKIHQDKPALYEVKYIEEILDETPIVTLKQLEIWQWIAAYYLCNIGEVLKAALPSALLLESETVVELNKEKEIQVEELSDQEYLIYEALQQKSILKVQEIMGILGLKKVLPIIQAMATKDVVVINQELYKQYKPKLVRYVKISEAYRDQEQLTAFLATIQKAAPKQYEVMLSYFSIEASTKKPITPKQLAEAAKTTPSTIKSLVSKGVLDEYYLQHDRMGFQGDTASSSPVLTPHQTAAFEAINTAFLDKNVCLLHGVTSSGKTEVYVKLIEAQLQQDKQVLFMVPEIGLTTQLIARLQRYFGEEVQVYHSRNSVNERVETYQHVLTQTKGKIVIGTRSAVFLPFKNLGLIIVDEEHETTYKQYDPAPRYNARDISVLLAQKFNAKVLLGSATPSLESYDNAKKEKYALVELTKRYGNVLPPAIQLVDLKQKYKRKQMTGHFSDTLLQEMKTCLGEGKQVILFQNRRGYSPILECNTCGFSPQCPNCDVSLTYHKHNHSLRCHYCGYHIAMQLQCMGCGSTEISTKGFGTEQIETELKSVFKDYKIARMDLDTTRGKYACEKIISEFEQQQIDILVGTQMLAKGLDFRNVALVGIMNADTLLNYPDFRAHERCFQLLVQVSGRAGRTKEQGKVLIQSFNPNHQILQQVTTNQYAKMAEEQLYERKNFKYPPSYKLIRVVVKHKDYNAVNEAADWLTKAYQNAFKEYVLGPEFPPVMRIRNAYIKYILIKVPPAYSLQKTKAYLERINISFSAIGAFRKIRLNVNVDPY